MLSGLLAARDWAPGVRGRSARGLEPASSELPLGLDVHDDRAPHLDRDAVLRGGPETCFADSIQDRLVDAAPGWNPLLYPCIRNASRLVDEDQDNHFAGDSLLSRDGRI